jgi:uridine kinase
MDQSPFVVGVAGGTGAGKTTVTRELADAVGASVAVVPMDNYYEDLSGRPPEEREDVNFDHPGAFEWDLLVEHIDRLLAGEAVEMPQYDFTAAARCGSVRVEPGPVVVVEGILALHEDRLLDRQDLRVYVETDADVRILRRIRRDVVERDRDVEGVMEQYLSTVKPAHERFVAPTKAAADVVIPEGANATSVRLLADRVRSALADAASPSTAVGSGRGD